MNDKNSTINISNYSVSGKTAVEVLELACLSQVDVLTLFGNSLVILAFVFGPRSIRTLTNYFVVNLSVSDLTVGCISLPFWIVFRADEQLISDNVFSFLISLDVLCGITSILNLAAISIERMVAVKFPSTHINLSKASVMKAIFATWVIGIIMSASKFGARDHRLFTVFIFTLGFVIPLFVIIASYCVIFYAAINMMKSANENISVSRELRVAKTVSVIISLFVICWMPFFVVNMVFVFCTHCSRPLWVIYVSKMMHYSNSMMNFFVYGARSPDFRNFFKKILCSSGRNNSAKKSGSMIEPNTRTLSASEITRFVPDSDESFEIVTKSRSSRYLEVDVARVKQRDKLST